MDEKFRKIVYDALDLSDELRQECTDAVVAALSAAAQPERVKDGAHHASKLREVAAYLSAERMQGWANPLVTVLTDAADAIARLVDYSHTGDVVASALPTTQAGECSEAGAGPAADAFLRGNPLPADAPRYDGKAGDLADEIGDRVEALLSEARQGAFIGLHQVRAITEIKNRIRSATPPSPAQGTVERAEAEAQAKADVAEVMAKHGPLIEEAVRRASPPVDSDSLKARIAQLEVALRAMLDCPDIADNDFKDEETHAAERIARAALSNQGSRSE